MTNNLTKNSANDSADNYLTNIENKLVNLSYKHFALEQQLEDEAKKFEEEKTEMKTRNEELKN